MQALTVEASPELMVKTAAYDEPYLVKTLPVNNIQVINILLVEDDDVAVERVMRNMEMCGARFPIVIAEDGLEALDILRNKHISKKLESPYLVLLDLKMPHMDGFEFLDAIRHDAALASTEVFILTTSDSNADRVKASYYHVAGYLVKGSIAMFNWLFSSLSNDTRSSKL